MSNDSNDYQSRKLPLASELIYFPVTVLFAVLNLISRSLNITGELSCLIQGGFFGFALIPVVFLLSIIIILQEANILPRDTSTSSLFAYVGLPFAIYYVATILILDETHLQVERANPQPPRNWLERSADSFASTWNIEATCVPWDEKATLDPHRQYIFAVHPHGIHCTPLIMFSNIGSEFDKLFPGLVGHKVTGLAATIIFKLPVVRELFIRNGYIDARRKFASRALEKKRSLFVCTGGEEESMHTTMGDDIVVLKNRKGFVRLALSYGAELVPVFGVGNTDLYRTYSFLLGPRLWLQKKFGIALPLFHGKYLTPLPYEPPGGMKILIGKPLVTPKPKVLGERPDEDLVNEYHAKYIKSLTDLHAKHVTDRKLQIR